MSNRIIANTEQLEKVLKPSRMSVEEFMARLTNVKVDEYKTKQLQAEEELTQEKSSNSVSFEEDIV